jgi:hypothetical protein
MHKKIVWLALILALSSVLPVFAEEETFTITTYYPSPYGSYNQLEVYRSVTYKPVDKDTITDPREGEMIYDSTKDRLYLYNGSKWVAQGAGTDIYFPKCSWSCGVRPDRTSYQNTDCTSTCTPPNCASGYTDLGTGCTAMGGGLTIGSAINYGAGNMVFITYGNGYGYCERYCAKQ